MSVKLKSIQDQVVFITGATNEIGLATVNHALLSGAKVYMVGPDEEALQTIQDRNRMKQLSSAYSVADVTEVDQLQIAAEHCVATFGRIDTWINNASISIDRKMLETQESEARELFDENFWSVVNGSRVALPLLKVGGGSLINLGRTFSDEGLPLHGIYMASKLAVKGYTDGLRRELKTSDFNVSLSLVLPGLSVSPDDVALMILKCAQNPIRKIEGDSFVLRKASMNFLQRLREFYERAHKRAEIFIH